MRTALLDATYCRPAACEMAYLPTHLGQDANGLAVDNLLRPLNCNCSL